MQRDNFPTLSPTPAIQKGLNSFQVAVGGSKPVTVTLNSITRGELYRPMSLDKYPAIVQIIDKNTGKVVGSYDPKKLAQNVALPAGGKYDFVVPDYVSFEASFGPNGGTYEYNGTLRKAVVKTKPAPSISRLGWKFGNSNDFDKLELFP